MTAQPQLSSGRLVGRVPIKNLWLLMLYASDLTKYRGPFTAIVEADEENLPDLVAQLLSRAVEHRLKRNLTRGYRHRDMVLTRVRGRINILETDARLLLQRGEVSCRFEDLTIDTPRNRLVKAALQRVSGLVRSESLRSKCRLLALGLARAGVNGPRPSGPDLARDQFGRNDTADRLMVSLAQLALDLALPSEEAGAQALLSPEREEAWVRRLFEKAVLGFAQAELEPLGWSVRGGLRLGWRETSASDGLREILPPMITDIVLDPPCGGRRVVVDTKFTSILTSRRFGGEALKSPHLYQIYAYLNTQVGVGGCWEAAGGLLLYPAISSSVHEHAVFSGHPIAFATVNLDSTALEIRSRLRKILTNPHRPCPETSH